MMARALKGPLALVLAVMMVFSGGGMVAYAADGTSYNADDVAAFQAILDAHPSLLQIDGVNRNDPASWQSVGLVEFTGEGSENQRITKLMLFQKNLTGTLDVSGLTELTKLYCFSNKLEELNMSGLTKLTYLDCGDNQLLALDVSGLKELTYLSCVSNKLQELDVSKLTKLVCLSCGNNQLQVLDVSKLTELNDLDCIGNQLQVLDVSRLTELTDLYCSDNELQKLDVSRLTKLTSLYCSNNQLQVLDVSQLTNLVNLECINNQLQVLDMSKLTSLANLSCSENQLQVLDVSGLAELSYLCCGNLSLQKLDISGLTKLTTLSCYADSMNLLHAIDGHTATILSEAGGTGGIYSVSKETGEPLSLQLNAFPEDGYSFKEWQVTFDGVAVKDSGFQEPFCDFMMPAKDVTAKAIFVKDEIPDGPDNPDNPDNPENPDTPEIPKTPEEIKQEAETIQDPERLKDLEDAYKNLTGTTVNVLADNNTHGDFKNQVDKISVTGAAFNVEPGETVSLHFSKPQNNVTIDGTKYKTNSAVQLDISLRSGEKVLSRLAVPVTITVPIPSGVNPQNFWILHYNDAGEYEVINPTLNGDGTCSFTVDHFSVFAFVNAAGTPDPVEPAGEEKQEKKEKDDSNQQAVKAALEAIRAAKPGKQQTAATADGRQVTVVPVKLFGLSASLPVDALETIAEGTIGLRVVLDNGAAEVLIPAGFRMPAGTGVLAYGLGWQAEPLYSNLMRADVKEEGAKTEVYKLGGGTLPTTATITLKTKLTGKINVYRWDENTRRAALVASPAAEGGRVTFAAKELGNFILTTGTI